MVKLNFRLYIRQYTFPNENFDYSYPLSDFVLILHGKECCFCSAVIAASVKPCIIVVIHFDTH